MAPRFDADASTLDLAVADLLDSQQLRSLGFAYRGGHERMWLGQAIHSRYQEQAIASDPSYQREVVVRHQLISKGWQITINGRVDGLRTDRDGSTVVEEIKSVRRGVTLLPAVRELYEKQAAIYAWMLGSQSDAEIRCELVLIEIGSDDIERVRVPLKPRLVRAVVMRRIRGLIAGYRDREQKRQARRETARELIFPYPDSRAGQDEIIDTVAAALDNREHLLVEASTGIGKTVAALYPSLRFALERDKRVFVLTAKTLQQEMATHVLDLLNQDQTFHSLRLRAKSKMCANDQLLCHEDYCRFAAEFQVKMQQKRPVEALLGRFGTLLPDDIFETSKKSEVCPFEVSLDLSRRAQVTVCDYNYAFDPYVSMSEFGPDGSLSDTILVIDEIHNLVGRGRGYYSPSLSAFRAERAAVGVGRGGHASIHLRLADLCLDLANLVRDTVTDYRPHGLLGDFADDCRLPDEELWALRARFDRAFVDYLEHRRETKTFTADDRFVDLYFELVKFIDAMMLVESDSGSIFSTFVEHSGDDDCLRILCKDPSRFLGAAINRCHSVVGLSATLSPEEFYRDLLGFDPARTSTLHLPSPFPAHNRRVVIDSSVSTTYRERPTNYPRIADSLASFADATPGNCLVLFPSYSFLGEVATRLRPERKRVLLQARGDGDRQRDEILSTLRSAILGDVLLLAVAGGVFAEGVDYPGEVLKAVAIVGPCLPPLTLEQRLLQDYYQERFERGFEYAFVVPGMVRVVQAAGRLIRSATDTGVIALLDKRFMRPPYRNHLPKDWIPDDGIRSLAEAPEAAARQFFETLA